MRKYICIFLVLLSSILFFSFLKKEKSEKYKAGCKKVVFYDKNLEAAIRSILNKPTGNIYNSDCEKITSLIQCLNNKGIKDLNGLQYFKNLQELELYNNNISDISHLSELTELTYLNLSFNNISNISALSKMTKLESLNLEYNNISDISPLSTLVNLVFLTLSHNNIYDLSSLSGLLKLNGLYLNNNNIKDITALVKNCKSGGLGAGDSIDLDGNPLKTDNKDIVYLSKHNVNVHFCNAQH